MSDLKSKYDLIETMENTIANYEDRIYDIRNEIEKEIAEDNGYWEVEMGSEECDGDSPIEICFYDPMDDPCRDHCIFCGQPEERK